MAGHAGDSSHVGRPRGSASGFLAACRMRFNPIALRFSFAPAARGDTRGDETGRPTWDATGS